MTGSQDPLLQPFTLRHLTLRNRIVSTPHSPAFAEEGMPKERYQRYHEEKARGGIGMTMFGGSSCVGPDSPSVFGQLDVGTDAIIPYLKSLTDRVHGHGARTVCQISHLGRRSTWNAGHWLPLVAPSRVREPAHRGFPKEMDEWDIRRVVGDYAAAARRCRDGGVDGVEVMQNGHLPGQFLSPHTNHRRDGYGGSLKNRARFMLEVLEAIRESAGDDFVLGARVDTDSKLADGLSPEESLEALHLMQEQGCVDYFNLNVGRFDNDFELGWFAVPAMFQKLAPWLQTVGLFKRELDLPVIHATRILDLATARYAVSEGILDLVGMTRAHIADPWLVYKLQSGQESRIRPCVGAGYCIDRIYNEGDMVCTHNVATGRENEVPQQITRARKAGRRVVVVGGGPAGMEAARVCAERGHRVVLFEASGELGGQVLLAGRAEVRRDILGITDWLAAELGHLGVVVHWNVLADEETVLAETPDVIVIATGGLPDTRLVPGAEACLSTWDVLSGTPVSGDVLVYDDHGQHQGASTVDQIAEGEARVELVTPDRHACAEMGSSNFPMYMRRFHHKGVTVTPDYRLRRVEHDSDRLRAVFENEFGGGKFIDRVVDYMIVEHGTVPNDALYGALRSHSVNDGVTDYGALLSGKRQPHDGAPALYRVGDAVASRNIHAAILDARRLCQSL
ncbi:MAG: NADH:flavin oxidoreductase [Gammaproteobacteria bacterium]|nr:NADH:flavin oxidoreductase [Gammaproteobacteria bacterium]